MKVPLKKITDLNIIIILILFVILFKNLNFFKNGYLLLTKTINERQQKYAYDFCENNSSGYVFYIKNKFNLKKKPLIINYHIEPKQDWIFKKDNINENSSKIILLNYKINKTYNFIKIKGLDYWVSYDMATPGTSKGGKYFEFIGDVKNLDTEYKANFYKKEIAVLMDVKKIKFDYKKSINDYEFEPGDTDLGGVTFGVLKEGKKYILSKNSIKFDDHDSLKFIKFDDDFDDTGITNIKLHLHDNIDLSKFKILDNHNNECFLIQK
jgi:hypothetical protein